MKSLVIVLAIFLLAGCNAYMAPQYQAQLETAVGDLDAMVAQCPDPNAAPQDYCEAIKEASRTLKLVLDESYGRRPQ